MLITCLARKETARVAAEALSQYGKEVVPLLKNAMLNPETPKPCLLQFPRVLQRIGTQSCLEILVDHIEHEDEDIRWNVMISIERMVNSTAEVDVNLEQLAESCGREVRSYFQQTAAICDLKECLNPLLLGDALAYRRFPVKSSPSLPKSVSKSTSSMETRSSPREI